MFKRLFWLLVGIGFGFGASFWVMRFVRETAARYTPERVSTDMADAIKSLGIDLREAVADGREAMREREAELRAEVAGPNGNGHGAGNGSGPASADRW